MRLSGARTLRDKRRPTRIGRAGQEALGRDGGVAGSDARREEPRPRGSSWPRARRTRRSGARGATHFLEHLLFKRTRRRSGAAIARITDRLGGDCDAYTTKECVAFHARVPAARAAEAVDLLLDLTAAPAFTAADVEVERGVILEEIAEAHDVPDDLLHDTFVRALWPAHDLGAPIFGTRESVERPHARDSRGTLPGDLPARADARRRRRRDGSGPPRRAPRAGSRAPGRRRVPRRARAPRPRAPRAAPSRSRARTSGRRISSSAGRPACRGPTRACRRPGSRRRSSAEASRRASGGTCARRAVSRTTWARTSPSTAPRASPSSRPRRSRRTSGASCGRRAASSAASCATASAGPSSPGRRTSSRRRPRSRRSPRPRAARRPRAPGSRAGGPYETEEYLADVAKVTAEDVEEAARLLWGDASRALPRRRGAAARGEGRGARARPRGRLRRGGRRVNARGGGRRSGSPSPTSSATSRRRSTPPPHAAGADLRAAVPGPLVVLPGRPRARADGAHARDPARLRGAGARALGAGAEEGPRARERRRDDRRGLPRGGGRPRREPRRRARHDRPRRPHRPARRRAGRAGRLHARRAASRRARAGPGGFGSTGS